jgi:group I intron endonuclease
MWYVYKISNLLNNKIYIGKTVNIRRRWNKHKTAAKRQNPNDFTILHRAIRKYGPENFIIEGISEHEIEEKALAQEVYLIAVMQSTNRDIGYNMTNGGDGVSGYKHTEESKQKMSVAKTGIFNGEQNPFYGKTHDKNMRDLLSQQATDRYQANPSKYDQFNIKRCSLNTEECIKIQQQYLQGSISMEELAKNYSVPISTIHSVIYGNYVAIRGYSILTEESIDQIIMARHQKQVMAYKTFSPEQEREIADKYSTGTILVRDLAKEYGVSKPTISKAIKAQGVKIRRGPAKQQS